jgi:hypothetical protein
MRIPRIVSYSFISYVYFVLIISTIIQFLVSPCKCKQFCYPDNYSYSSMFSFLLPPCSYFFFFVTYFLFLFFPHLATSLSCSWPLSLIFFRNFILYTLFFFLQFPFFFSSSFTFRYLCVSLLSLFCLLNSFPFVSSRPIILVFLLSATYLCSSICHTHTQYLVPVLISVLQCSQS